MNDNTSPYPAQPPYPGQDPYQYDQTYQAQPQYPMGNQYQGYPPPPGPPTNRNLQIALAVLIGVLLAAIIGLAVYWFGFRDSSEHSTAAPSSTTTLTNTVQPGPAESPWTPVPPAGTFSCGGSVGAAGPTSCEFAQNVAAEYLRTGPKGDSRTISAYSPATGITYMMSCNLETGVVVCRGGNNAAVVVY